MKKRIIALTMLAAVAVAAEGKVRYRGFVEAPFGVSVCADEFGDDAYCAPNVGLSTNHGVQFGQWYTGLGVELAFPETSFFARGRYDFPALTKRWRPYAQADAGLLFGSYYSDGELGASLRLGAGMNLNIWRNLGLDFGINLSAATAGGGWGYTFGLRIGLDF